MAVTQAMADGLEAVERAERVYRPGRDSASLIELPKLALADAVIAAARAQALDRLPRARPAKSELRAVRRARHGGAR